MFLIRWVTYVCYVNNLAVRFATGSEGSGGYRYMEEGGGGARGVCKRKARSWHTKTVQNTAPS